MTTDVTIRPATQDDILLFFGKPLEFTIRAWVADYRGKPACLAGVRRTDALSVVAFSELAPGLDAPKKTIWRGANELFEKIKGIGVDVMANPDCNIPGAERFLGRLGFQRVDNGVYIWVR